MRGEFGLAALFLVALGSIISLFRSGTSGSAGGIHPKDLRSYLQSQTTLSPLEREISFTFRPVLAHAAHPTTRKILLHNASSPSARLSAGAEPFYDAFSTDLNPPPSPNPNDPWLPITTLTTSTPPSHHQPLILRSKAITLTRPTRSHPNRRITSLNATRSARIAFNAALAENDEWEDTTVMAPDVRDRETLLALAKMASNAYVTPEGGEWWGLEDWNHTVPFGWEKDADGLRGHVFASDDNSTVVISIKGTSAGLLGGGGPTAKNDKFNDNLLFSCCCARVDFSWSTVCDCYAGGYKCEEKCLEEAVIGESVYTSVGTNLYNNISSLYPHANIWLVGHSLGGSLASLIGLSFGSPVVAYEAPGERLAAQRLHLPLPPGMPHDKMGITHVYNNADPIPMGQCVGPYSGCYAAGFALETSCHVGQSIIYDTKGKKGWSSDIRAHRITEVINRILNEDWEDPPTNITKTLSYNTPHSVGADLPAIIAWLPQRMLEILDSVREMSSSLIWGWPGKRKGPPAKGEEGSQPPVEEQPRRRNPNAVPRPESEASCTDCFRWEFGNGWKKEPPTTTIETLIMASSTGRAGRV